jgi:hypothetical protein
MRPFNKKPAISGGLASTAGGRLFRFLYGFDCIFPLPFDARLAELESVVVLDRVHVVRDVMVDKGLDFADKGAMNSHLFGGNKPGLLHDPAVMSDGVECPIQAVQASVGLQLSSNMVDSHLCSSFAWVVRAAFGLIHRALPVIVYRMPVVLAQYGLTLKTGGQGKLGHYQTRDAFDIKLLRDSGATLDSNLKADLTDGPAAEKLEDPDYIAKRISQVNSKTCRPELQPYLPKDVYDELEEVGFESLRQALRELFSEWL